MDKRRARCSKLAISRSIGREEEKEGGWEVLGARATTMIDPPPPPILREQNMGKSDLQL